MRILHITNNYAPVGGTEYYVYNVCNGLEKRNHENIVIYSNRHNTTWTKHNRKTFFIKGIADFNCSGRAIDEALSVIKEENPDIIYLHIVSNPLLIEKLIELKPTIQYIHNHNLYCPSAFMSTRLFKCPGKFNFLCFIYCLSGNCRGCKPGHALKRFKIVKANLSIAKKLDALIVASEYMKQRLINNGISEDKIYVIPYFAYPKQSDAQNIKGNMPTILFVGRICKFKGIDYLIKALKYIKQPCKLIIAGDGYYMDYVKKLSRRLKVDKYIEFRGWLNQKELEECYRQSLVVVMPSIWPEPFGIVGIEAASYAKPIVAFDVGGISEWLKDGEDGLLVEELDIKTLAEKMKILLKDSGLAIRFGIHGKQMVEEKFMVDNHIASLIDLFLETIKLVSLR